MVRYHLLKGFYMAIFKDKEEYLNWSNQVVSKIYLLGIKQKNQQFVMECLNEIATKLSPLERGEKLVETEE